MRPTSPAVSRPLAVNVSGRSSSMYISRIACVAALLVLGATAGCKRKAPPVEEQTAAPAPAPAPAAAPAVVPHPVPASALPNWKPVSDAATGIEIPMVKGLLIDSTITAPIGDLEHIEKIVDMDATTITVEVQTENSPRMANAHPTDLTTPAATGKGTIVVDVAALASSNRFTDVAASGAPRHYSGSTERGVSTETLNQLRAGKLVQWQEMVNDGVWLLAAQMMTAAYKPGDRLPTKSDWGDYEVYQCNLQRVEPRDLSFPVVVNGEPVELPVLHAKCVLDNGRESHFYILDQPSNPLILYFLDGVSGQSNQVIKLSFDPDAEALKMPVKEAKLQASGGGAGSGKSMEAKLAEKEPVEIYGIYFDFNSAVIKPESEVVLKQISDVMQKNPAWKLSVAGHTDNIGGDEFNQKLSEARSAAVKKALVTEYKITPERLTTSGFGASRPIADNAKVEGRARNRRVELQRQ